MIRKKRLLILLVCGVLAGLVGLAVLWQFRDYLTVAQLQDWVKQVADLGPFVFFGCMAILPLFWFPMSPFLFLAPVFGTPVAIAGSLSAMAINMTLGWFVSGKLFRPFFERLVARFGYEVPELSNKGLVGLTLALRLTPGVPFPLQNYLLGLARMPFGLYLLVSIPTNALVSVSVLLFGEALMKGSVGLALAAVGVFAVVTLIVRTWQVRMKARELAS